MRVTDTFIDVPTAAEMNCYFDQDYAEVELITAMAAIGQTYTYSSHHGPLGSHQVVAIRTDHIGPIRRAVVDALFRVIGWIARPDPKPEAPLDALSSNDAGNRDGELSAEIDACPHCNDGTGDPCHGHG
ncbi:hypothetical protein [Burkholderia stagnalis]|nr:hypothetical protein [Burkholderia stagnalis]